MTVENMAAIVLWGALALYALLGGVAFGATIWSLLSFRKPAEQRFIQESSGALRESHHGWLIFSATVLLIAFPDAFGALTSALLWPFLLILAGIVLRGVALILRTGALRTLTFSVTASKVCSAASLITPFLLGASVGIVATGQIYPYTGGYAVVHLWTRWVVPYALVLGAVALALCAMLAAISLAVQAEKIDDQTLTEAFRWHAIVALGTTVILCVVGLILAQAEAPILWNGMFAQAMFFVAFTVICALLMLLALFQKRYQRARIEAIIGTLLLFCTWALVQGPYLVPPAIKIDAAAAPNSVLQPLMLATTIGAAVLLGICYVRMVRMKSG